METQAWFRVKSKQEIRVLKKKERKKKSHTVLKANIIAPVNYESKLKLEIGQSPV